MEIPGLRGLTAWELTKRVVAEYLDDDMLTYAAALAYHLLFALFPFLLFLIALLGFLDLQGLFDWLVQRAQPALPGEAMRLVEDVIAEIRTGREGGLLSFGIAAAVWVASVGMRSSMNALNRAYDVEEGRSRLERYSLSIVYTLAFAVLVILATALMVVGPQLVADLAGGLGGAVIEAWRWLRIPAALLLAMLAVALVYYFAPSVEQKFRYVTPGSVLAVLLWAAMSGIFQYYVSNFGRYDATYGSIGAVIVLLLYFFLSSAVLLLGGEVNSVIYQHSPRTGDPRPRSSG